MKRISLIILSVLFGLFALFALAAALRIGDISSVDSEATQYDITELGTLGGPESRAVDVNNLGQVIGSSSISEGEPSLAFLWHEGSIVSLTVPASLSTSASAINDQSIVAGTAISGSGEDEEQWPILWAGGTYSEPETLSGTQSTARAINNMGLAAGNTISESDNSLLLWEDVTLSTTIPISGGSGWVNGLNDLGQLAGYIENTTGNEMAYRWANGVLSPLDTLGGTNSRALDINNLSQIVGTADISGDLASHAFLWENGAMTDLGTPGGVLSATSQANSINNLGIAVGQAEISGQLRAVLWQDGQIIDLNTVLPAEHEWDLLVTAASINDEGWIAGTGLLDGNERAFLLQPIPPVPPVYLPVIARPELPATPTPKPTPSPTPTPVPSGVLDMNRFMIGNGVLYEVWHSLNNSQARYQTETGNNRFYHTKGNEVKAEWEELWTAGGYIYRGTDTSPGFGEFYTLYQNVSSGAPVGSRWSPRYWKVGDVYERNPYVVFRRKADCAVVRDGTSRTWLKFEAYYPQYTFQSGITLQNVIQLGWLLSRNGQPEERYFYAEGYGLVGWSSRDRGYSNIAEIHGPGQRPDNQRETLHCFSSSVNQPLRLSPQLTFGELPEEYVRRVK